MAKFRFMVLGFMNIGLCVMKTVRTRYGHGTDTVRYGTDTVAVTNSDALLYLKGYST